MDDVAHRFRDRLRENRTFILILRLMFLALALGWLVYALFAHSLIESMYNGESFEFLNRIIEDQELSPPEHYFQKADQLFLLANVCLIIVLVLATVILVKHDTAFGNRITLAILSSVILIAMFFAKPVSYGDAPGYFLVTESLFNHLTPDLQERDMESPSAARLKEQFDPRLFEKAIPRNYYVPAKDGREYSMHFWVYPLVNLPAKAALRVLSLNEAKAFQITNAIFLVLALVHIILIAAFTELEKRLLMFLVLLCPAFWFLYWPHTEVFSYSLVIVSLVYMSRQKWRPAIFCAAVGATQNPPIIFFVAFMWIKGMMQSEHKLKDLVVLSLLALPALGPNLFSLAKYGTLSVYVNKGTSLDNISVFKASELFIDLNLGMLPYIPLTLLMFFGILLRDVLLKRKFTLGLQFFVVLFVMMLACTPTIFWNHGTSGPSRYVIWMLPLVFYAVTREVGKAKPSRSIYVSCVWIAIVVQTFIVLHGRGYRSVVNQNRHTYLSKLVLNHLPALYNPTYEIFAFRTTHKHPGFVRSDTTATVAGEYETPVVYRYKGECRKAMVRGRDKEALEDLCGSIPESKKAFFENKENREKTIYVNY